MIMKAPKFFTTLPKVDSKHEKERIIYYPTRWKKNSSRKPNMNIYITVFNRIRISKLHFTTTRGDLHEKFSCFGAIAAISPIMIMQKILYNDRQFQGHAFITFYLEKDAQCALKTRIRYLNGNEIYLHPAKEQPLNMHYEVEPMDRRYTMRTILAINHKYKKYFLDEGDGFTPKMCYALLKAIEANVPHKIKRTTICDPTSDDDESCSTCPRTWDNVESSSDQDSIPCLEEIPPSPVEIIPNEWEFNPEHFHGLDDQNLENFVYPDPLYFDGNQTNLQDPVQLNSHQFENPLTLYTVYYGENKIIYDPIPQHNEIANYQGDGYYDTNNQYSIPEENLDPYHVDPSMYPDACGPIINLNAFETENNQLYPLLQVNATFHEYPIYTQPNEIDQFANLSDANYLQVLAPQPIISPELEIHEYYEGVDTANLIAYDECNILRTSDNNVNNGTSSICHLIPYQNYAESSLEPVNVDTFDIPHFIPYQNNAEYPVRPALNVVTFEVPHLIPYHNYVDHPIEAAVNDYRSEVTDLIPYHNSAESSVEVSQNDYTVGIPRIISYQVYTKFSMTIVNDGTSGVSGVPHLIPFQNIAEYYMQTTVNNGTYEVPPLIPYQNYAVSSTEATVNDGIYEVPHFMPYQNEEQSSLEVAVNDGICEVPYNIPYQNYTDGSMEAVVNDGIYYVVPHFTPHYNYADYSMEATVNDGIYEVPHFIPYQNEAASSVEVAVNNGICEVPYNTPYQNCTDGSMEAVVNDGIYEVPHFTPHYNYVNSSMEATVNNRICEVPHYTLYNNYTDSPMEAVVNDGIYEVPYFTQHYTYADSSVEATVSAGIHEVPHFTPYQYEAESSVEATVNNEIYEVPHYTPYQNYTDSSMEAVVKDGIYEVPHFTPYHNYVDSSVEATVNDRIYEVPHFTPHHNNAECSVEANINDGIYEVPHFTPYPNYANSSMEATVNDGIFEVPHFTPYQNYADPSVEATVNTGIYEVPHFTPYHNYMDSSVEATINNGIYEVPHFTPHYNYVDSSVEATVNNEIYEVPHFTPYQNYVDSSVETAVNDGIYEIPHFTPYPNYVDSSVEATVNDGICEVPHFIPYQNYIDCSTEATVNSGIYEEPHFTPYNNYAGSSMEATINDGIYEVPHFTPYPNYVDSSVETAVNDGIYEVPHFTPYQNYVDSSVEATVNNGIYEVPYCNYADSSVEANVNNGIYEAPHFTPHYNNGASFVEATVNNEIYEVPHFTPYQNDVDSSVETAVNDGIYEVPHFTPYPNYVDSSVEATINDGLCEVPHLTPYQNYIDYSTKATVNSGLYEEPHFTPYNNYAGSSMEATINDGIYEVPHFTPYPNYVDSSVETAVNDEIYEVPHYIPYHNYINSSVDATVNSRLYEGPHFTPYHNNGDCSVASAVTDPIYEVPYFTPYQNSADCSTEAAGNNCIYYEVPHFTQHQSYAESTMEAEVNGRMYEVPNLFPYQNYSESSMEAPVIDGTYEVPHLIPYQNYADCIDEAAVNCGRYEIPQYTPCPNYAESFVEIPVHDDTYESSQFIPYHNYPESFGEAPVHYGTYEAPHLIPYQIYADSFVETLKQMEASENQFSEAQFLQSEQSDKDEETTRSLKYNDDTNTLVNNLGEFEQLEIEQRQEYELFHLLPYQNYTESSMEAAVNHEAFEVSYLNPYEIYSESFEQSARHFKVYEHLFSDAPYQFLQLEENDLDEESTQSLQCNRNGTVDVQAFEHLFSDAPFQFLQLEENDLDEESTQSLQCNRHGTVDVQAFEHPFSDAPFQFLQSEESLLDEESNETFEIIFCESDAVEIDQLQESEVPDDLMLYHNYVESSEEAARHFETFEQQFSEAPFQFLRSEESDLDENQEEPTQSLLYNTNETADITFCEEIEQPQEFEIPHLNPYQNYAEFFEKAARQLQVFKQQFSDASEKSYLSEEPRQSLQWDPNETVNIDFCESDPADIKQLEESEVLRFIPYHSYAESSLEAARKFRAFEQQICDAPFQFLQSEKFDFCESDPVDIEQLQESEIFSFIPYHNYAESLEAARKFRAFEQQFSDAPFQFLQSEKYDLDEEIEPIQSLEYNPNETADITFCESDAVEEIEELQESEVPHLNPYQNYVEFFEEATRELQVFREQFSDASEKSYLGDEPNQSLQCNLNETINFCESDPADIEQLQESQVLNLIPYNYSECSVEAARHFEVFEQQFSDAPFQFLQSEKSDLDEDQEEPTQTWQCNPNTIVDDANTVFTFCESDMVEIEQLENYDEELKVGTSLNEEIKADVMESEGALEKLQGKYKITKRTCVVSVRDVATQFPEPGENLINTFATEVDETSLQDMETQTLCSPENEDGTTASLTYANITKCRKQ